MNTNKSATRSVNRKLLAALAVLAVAFVVLAAVPAVATDSDADPTSIEGNDATAALQADGEYILSQDSTVDGHTVIGDDLTLDLNGKTLSIGPEIRIYGVDVTIKNGKVLSDGSSDYFEIRPGDIDGSRVVFEDVVFENTYRAPTYGPCTVYTSKMVDVYCTGTDVGITLDFIGCTFNEATVEIRGGSDSGSSVSVSFDDCQFNNLGVYAPVEFGYYIEGGVTVKDCEFNLTATGSVSVIDTSFSDVMITFEGENTVNGIDAESSDDVHVLGTPSVKLYTVNSEDSVVLGTDNVEVQGNATSQGDSYAATAVKNGETEYFGTVSALLSFLATDTGYIATIVEDSDITADATIASGNRVIIGSGVTVTIAAGFTLTVESDSELVISEGAVLVNEGTLALVEANDLVVNGTYSLVGNGKTLVNGSEVYYDGQRLEVVEGDETIVYTVTKVKLGGFYYYVGVYVAPVAYTGEPIDSEDIELAGFKLKVLSEELARGNDITIRVMENIGGSYPNPGTYAKAVSFSISVTDLDTGDVGRIIVYADLVISPVSLDDSRIEISQGDDLTYNGEDQTYEFTLTFGNRTLVEGVDYTVTCATQRNAGSYVAVVTAMGDFFTGTRDVEFDILKFQPEIELTDSTDGAGWKSEQYDGEITYEINVPETDGEITATLKITIDGTETTSTQVIASQEDLDDLIASIMGEDYDAGYTLEITLASAENTNFKAATSNTVTVDVGPYEAIKITVEFGDVEDSDVETTQNGTDVKIVSKDELGLAKTNGAYTFTINVEAAAGATSVAMHVTEDTAVTGRTLMTPADSYEFVVDEDGNITGITFTLEALPAGTYSLVVYAGDDATRYETSDSYTIDLTGLVSDDLAIWLHEGDKTVKYDTNQLWDLVFGIPATEEYDFGIPFLNGGKFYMPATQKSEFWTLKADGETVDTYQPGSVYLIDGDDRSSDGIIHFYASVAQYVAVIEGGYFESGAEADEYLSGIIGDAFLNDCVDGTMYFLFNLAADSDVTATLFVNDGEGIDLGTSSMTAGIHVVYFADVSIEYGHVDYGGYVPGYTYTVLIETENDVDYYVYEAPAEPGQVLDIVSVGYAADHANDAINAALEAAGYDGDEVTDADPAAVMYIVFTMSKDGSIGFSIDGEVLKTFEYAAGVHAIYWTTEDFVDGQIIEIGIADGEASDSIYYTYTAAAPVEPEPVEPGVEYTEAIVVAMYQNSVTKGVSIMIGTSDMKVIPAGKATITLSYMYTEYNSFLGEEVVKTGVMTMEYDFTGSTGFAFVPVDFSEQVGSTSILGAEATVTIGDLSDTSAFLAFTLA